MQMSVLVSPQLNLSAGQFRYRSLSLVLSFFLILPPIALSNSTDFSLSLWTNSFLEEGGKSKCLWEGDAHFGAWHLHAKSVVCLDENAFNTLYDYSLTNTPTVLQYSIFSHFKLDTT